MIAAFFFGHAMAYTSHRLSRQGTPALRAVYHLLIKFLLSALGLGLASIWLPGVRVDSPVTLFYAAALLGLANTFIRPVIVMLTLPASILSLGLFLLVINAAMLVLVSWVLPSLHIAGLWSALGAWLLIATANSIGTVLSGATKVTVQIHRR